MVYKIFDFWLEFNIYTLYIFNFLVNLSKIHDLKYYRSSNNNDVI
jgi:hypothetical protein